MKFNWNSNTGVYKGFLNFPATSGLTQSVSIPLYIKSHPIPVRQPKAQEVNTITNVDPQGNETAFSAMFFGSPDPLQIEISGFLITPITTASGTTKKIWDPTNDGTDTGTRLSLKGWSYADMIIAYIEGRLNTTSTGRWTRTDPSSYTDPYGNRYLNPIVMSWEASNQMPLRVHQFTLNLALEN